MAYTLTSSSASVNEDSTVSITVYTTGLSNGTLVPYSISGTGINSADFVGSPLLTGNFVINSNQATITLNPKADFKTEFPETVTLMLTNTGFNESIDIIINDTSKTVSNVIADIYVTADPLVILEGQTANFSIRATNVDPGTAVAYSIFGITGADLSNPSLISGIITLNSTNVINETSATLSLPLLTDYVTEGTESVVLILYPDFPYSLQVSGTVSVIDSSINNEPIYYLAANKNTVVEGSNVTIFLTTSNIPDGTIVPWRIYAFKRGEITDSDFEDVNNLTGFFPPLSANVANITLRVRDDFIFENTEIFYVGVPGTISSTQYISILDSGNTLITTDNTYTGNINVKFLDPAVLTANLGSVTRSLSFWEGTTGLLSENMVLQGKAPYATSESLALYHPFSYVIRSKISIENWRNSIKTLLHPAGLTAFSEINNDTALGEVLSLAVKPTEESSINIVDILTADEPGVYASNTLLDGTRTLTADSISLSINL
jgi:hypothetical protein